MQTVAYERWYLDEQVAAARRRSARSSAGQPPVRSALRPGIDKREPDPRVALATAAGKRGQSLAALSRMIGRPARYLDRFVRDGVPKALTANEHALLAAFFGVDERGLGVRQLWLAL